MNNKTIQFIKEHENDDIRNLALQTKRYTDIDMPYALQQIQGRQIAKNKIPQWYNNNHIVYPQHISLEQCSSEKTALYKASLCKGESMVDLTGGLGIDFSFMSRNFAKATYVERQKELTEIAIKNFSALNLQSITIINNNAENYLSEINCVSTIYIDPSRRSKKGEKTVFIEDCSPNLIEIEKLLDSKAEQVIIKMSPMLDISHAIDSLKIINEVHIVSTNNECKELLLIKNGSSDKKEIKYFCVNIKSDNTKDIYTFSKEIENTANVNYSDPKNYLYEPNASILKAGAYKSIAQYYNLYKLHPNSHLYTSDRLIKDFPGRSFIVKQFCQFNKKEIKKLTHQISKANITCRNFHLSVDQIRKKLSVKDGGDCYIFATTLINDKKILIECEKL